MTGARRDLPKKDDRPGILVAHEMPDHPKIAPLSDAAFRLLIRAWAYCSRLETNGRIPDAVWRTMGTPKARNELTAPPIVQPDASPLIIQRNAYVECHDYLSHQRSSGEIEAVRGSRSEAGEKGAHMRWHVGRRVFVETCSLCQAEAEERAHG